MVQELVRTGGLRRAETLAGHGGWLDRSGGLVRLPEASDILIEQLLAGLDPDAITLLAALSVAGIPLPREACSALPGVDAEGIEVAFDALVARGLVEQGPGDRWEVRVGLAGIAVRGCLSASRRLEIRRHAAAVLQRAPSTAALVRLHTEVGSLSDAVAHAVTWGTRQVRRGAGPLVVATLEAAARRAAQEGEVEGEQIARLHSVLAQAEGWSGEEREATERWLALAEAGARGPATRAETLLTRGWILRRQGRAEEAELLLQRAGQLAEAAGDPSLRARALLLRARAAALSGARELATEALHAAIEIARANADRGRIARIAALGATLAWWQQEPAQAWRWLEEGRRAAPLESRSRRWRLDLVAATLLRDGGRYGEALDLLRPQLRAVRRRGAPEAHLRLLVAIAALFVDLYQLGEARAALEEAEAVVGPSPSPRVRVMLALARGRLALMVGEPDVAAQLLAQGRMCAERWSAPAWRARLLAWEAAATGKAGEAGEADQMSRGAISALARLQHGPWHAEAVVARLSHIGRGPGLRAPILAARRWADKVDALPTQLDLALADAGDAAEREDDRAAGVLYRMAHDHFEALGERAGEEGRGALAVHPVRVRILRGLCRY